MAARDDGVLKPSLLDDFRDAEPDEDVQIHFPKANLASPDAFVGEEFPIEADSVTDPMQHRVMERGEEPTRGTGESSE